ncbi:hypothetical protein COCCADRAFT_81657 [Bipolaris zeicola 26-R-13]|uniref:Uncharacterized protein n=1 Tax=Cochliobolus carbonum (strain 26-R-13) TaxID=930089 RepID=W6Z5Q9_COCC2|nr:uncharacterized protein COCCADRAFT_81657 [Bipolaris zeicola 26-R-13]EUC39021.1 hypothetical protein COCCADRAFT_81657 [Bipolaris zeicola 26-R-13]
MNISSSLQTLPDTFLLLSSSSQYTQLTNTSLYCRKKNSSTNFFAFAMCKYCANLEQKIKDAGI